MVKGFSQGVGERLDNVSLPKPILCIQTGDVYDSVKEAGRLIGISHSSISRAVRGLLKSAAGYTFRYLTGDELKEYISKEMYSSTMYYKRFGKHVQTE